MKAFSHITSTVVPLAIKDIDTDMIIPAQFLTRISNQGYSDALFRRLRDSDPHFPLNQERFQQAKILVTESNFGCGSSREHAVWALRDAGFQIVISKSFADIFFTNAGKNGLVLITLPEPTVDALLADSVQGDYTLSIDLEKQIVTLPDNTQIPFDFDSFRKHCILHGLDDLDYLRSHEKTIDSFRLQQERVTFFRD